MESMKFKWEKHWKRYLFNITEYLDRTDLVWLQVDKSETPLPGGYVGWHGVESVKFKTVDEAFLYLTKNYNFYRQNSLRYIVEDL